jgi:hypothetical protein
MLPVSGIVALSYSVPGGVGPAPRIRYIKAAAAGETLKLEKPSCRRGQVQRLVRHLTSGTR